MNGFLISCKIFIKEALTNKINIFIFLIALFIFLLSIHHQIEKNKFVRDWKGNFVPISQDNLQKIMFDHTRLITIKLTICLFINCLIFNIVPIIIKEKFINSRIKIFNILKNDWHILLTYIISSIIIYNIFMLPYWFFMLYNDYSFYYRYTAGIIFFYNLFIVKMLLILLWFNLRADYIYSSIFKKIFTFLLIIVLNTLLSAIIAALNDVMALLAEVIVKIFCVVDYLPTDYFERFLFMSPVYYFPYEGRILIPYYGMDDAIKYLTIVFITVVIIFGYLSLKLIDMQKRNIKKSKPGMCFN